MSSISWFVHFQSESLGPLATEKVIQMLTQNRLQFADFAWRAGFTKWVRISEIDDFAAHLPGYPKVGIPDASAPKAQLAPEPQVQPEAEPAHAKKAPSPRPSPPKIASRYLRIPLFGKVVIDGQGSFEIMNIAERGVFVSAEEVLKIGTECQFRLEAEALGEPLEMRGIVIRHATDQDQVGFVIEFSRLNPVHKALIEQYVHKNSE